MNLAEISITAQWNLLYYVLLFALLLAYCIYIYKYTVPPISQKKKTLFIVLRTLTVAIILFLAFEPILALIRNYAVKPVNYVFIDDSKSMQRGSYKADKREIIKQFMAELKGENSGGQWEYYSFGENIRKISPDSISFLSYREPVTNFGKIFNALNKDDRPVASVTILSDGVITEGSSPVNSAERIGAPVYSVCLGDTSKQPDISIQDIKYSDHLYAGIEASIRVSILSESYNAGTVVKLFEEGKSVEEKTIQIREGSNQVTFNYTPKQSGEKKMSVTAMPLQGEKNKENNSKVFFLKVLNSKMKVLLVTGSLSSDFTFIKQALTADTNIIVKTIIEIGTNKYLSQYSTKDLDSSAVYFFVDYPSQSAGTQLFDMLAQRIRDRHKSIFLLCGNNTYLPLLKKLESELPVYISKQNPGSLEVQPYINSDQVKHPLVQGAAGEGMANFEEQPPVPRPNFDVTPKAESEVLIKAKLRNERTDIPLLVSRNIGSHRSAIMFASELWHWRLQKKSGAEMLYNGFFNDVNKWLSASSERERFVCNPTKKVYSSGERVEFVAELYDESFNPDNEEEISVDVWASSVKNSLTLNSIGNGLYDGYFEAPVSGDYSFSAKVKAGKEAFKKTGRFSVGEYEVEYAKTGADMQSLQELASATNGKCYFNQDYKPYFEIIKKIQSKGVKEVSKRSEIVLWNNYWVLIILISLFALEWFLRKREGML